MCFEGEARGGSVGRFKRTQRRLGSLSSTGTPCMTEEEKENEKREKGAREGARAGRGRGGKE